MTPNHRYDKLTVICGLTKDIKQLFWLANEVALCYSLTFVSQLFLEWVLNFKGGAGITKPNWDFLSCQVPIKLLTISASSISAKQSPLSAITRLGRLCCVHMVLMPHSLQVAGDDSSHYLFRTGVDFKFFASTQRHLKDNHSVCTILQRDCGLYMSL